MFFINFFNILNHISRNKANIIFDLTTPIRRLLHKKNLTWSAFIDQLALKCKNNFCNAHCSLEQAIVCVGMNGTRIAMHATAVVVYQVYCTVPYNLTLRRLTCSLVPFAR